MRLSKSSRPLTDRRRGLHAQSPPLGGTPPTTPPGSAGFCVLFGSTRPFSEAQLKSLYGTKSSYLKAYTTATDEDIKAGYILPADKAQVLAFAKQVPF